MTGRSTPRHRPPVDYRSLQVRSGSLSSEIAFVVRFVWHHPSNRRRRFRALARAIAFQVRHRLTGGETTARLGSRSRIVVPPHVPSASRALYGNPPDWPEMLVWERALSPGDVFVDVGANIGLYTIVAIEAGAEVIAIEPNRRAADFLRANLALNGYEAEVVVAALAAEPGTMLVTTDLDMGNRLVVGDPSPERSGAVEPIAVQTLDAVVGERTVAGVKIDVEGAERLVLEGAVRALREQRILLLQLEWNDTSVGLLGEDRSPVAALLDAAGYELLRPDYETGELVVVADPEFGHDVFARPRASSVGD